MKKAINLISFAKVASTISLLPTYLQNASSRANPTGKIYDMKKIKRQTITRQISSKQSLVHLEQDDSTFPARKLAVPSLGNKRT